MTVGLARSGWDVDLKFGEARETAFVSALTDCHVECKSDQKCRVTGNVAIEVRQGSKELGKGRKSGLSETTAKYWAIEFEDDAWVVLRTSILRAKCELAFNQRRRRMGGDGNRYECVLVPIAWLVHGWRAALSDKGEAA